MEFYLYTALFAPIVGSLFAALFGMSKKNIIAGIVPTAICLIPGESETADLHLRRRRSNRSRVNDMDGYR